jgi:uncharacterized LabA/DUF88 family protein
MTSDRVIVYIDGFNLYYGIRSKGWRRYYWLDVWRLALALLKPNQNLVRVKYFTSRVSSTLRDPAKSKRQGAYLEALQTLKGVDIHYGHYLENTVECFTCGSKWQVPEEKMTDVNIAVAMMVDAFQNRFDTALLISGDSDLTAPIQNIRRLLPSKRIVMAFPPDRSSVRLLGVAHAFFIISRKKLADSQFPDEIIKADGFVLKRPERWR